MYNQRVFIRAWEDFKVKKRHKGYEEWTFSESLYWAHRHIKSVMKNGL
jgi:hypothetical protein